MYSVICLFGSTRFESTFRELEKELTLKGYLAFSPLVYNQTGEIPGCVVEEKKIIDIATTLKINHSDIVLVVDENEYIGKSINDQVNHAFLLNKPVLYYSKGDVDKL